MYWNFLSALPFFTSCYGRPITAVFYPFWYPGSLPGYHGEELPPMEKRITQLFADRVGPPKEGRIEYWHDGLGLRVSASGAKSWVAMYRVGGRKVRETLGTLSDIPNVAEARRRADASAEAARKGVNPV